jgi:hypothetical protein
LIELARRREVERFGREVGTGEMVRRLVAAGLDALAAGERR